MQNEAGEQGWVIDPKNPNRATYTDPDSGEVYEAFREVKPVEADAPKYRTDINGNPRRLLGENERVVFGQTTDTTDYNKFVEEQDKKKAAALATAGQMLAGRKSFQEITTYLRNEGFQVNDPEGLKRIIDTGEGLGRGFIAAKTVQPPAEQAVVPEEEARGMGERFGDAIQEGSLYGFAGIAGRKIGDWIDQFKNDLRQQYPGMSEDFYEVASDEAISNMDRHLRAEWQKKTAADPAWRPDESWVENILSVNRWAPALAGDVIGSVGPESLIAPGSTALGRIAAQTVVSGLANAAYQGGDYVQGVSDGFNPTETLIDAGLGGLFQGAGEGLGKLAKTLTPEAKPDPALQNYTNALTQADEIAANGLKARVRPEIVDQAAEAVTARVNNIAGKWKNAPQIEVHRNFDNIPDVDPTAVGVITPEGKILLNTENIAREAMERNVTPDEMVAAVTFHEALGHHGLTQKFGDELDAILENLYARAPSFTRQVDAWMEANPDAYADDVNPLARSAEEVLAEMSESGKIDPTLFERFRAWIRDMARRAGLDLDINDNEVRVILGMAHAATVSGKRNDVAGNGFRYMYAGEKAEYAPDKTEEANRWFEGPDGKARWEMDDSPAVLFDDQLTAAGKTGKPLEEVLHHPELFDNYPQLRDMKITNERSFFDLWGAVQGWYDSRTKTLNITPNAKDPRGTILHEIQHAIQDIEGFARGGNTDKALQKMPLDHLEETAQNLYNYRKKIVDKKAMEVEAINNFATEHRDFWRDWRRARSSNSVFWDLYQKNKEQYKDAWLEAHNKVKQFEKELYRRFGLNPDEIEIGGKAWKESEKLKQIFIYPKTIDEVEERVAKLTKDFKEIEDVVKDLEELLSMKRQLPADIYRNELIDGLGKDEALKFQAYESLFGEVEARDTANRQNLTEEERAATKPYTSEEYMDPSAYVFDMGDEGPTVSRSESGSRYMRRTVGRKGPSEGSLQGGSTKESNLRLGNLRSNRNIEGILEENAPEFTPQSWDEWINEAEDIRNLVKNAKGLTVGATPPEVLAAREAIIMSANRIADLSKKAADGTLSPQEEYKLFAEMARNADMQDALAGVRSNAARIVNSFKIGAESDAAFTDAIRYMMKNTNNTVLSNPSHRQQFFQMVASAATNPTATNRLVKNAFKAKAEDYIFRVWYNMLLSSPATHAANFLGTGSNFVYDLLENTGAAILGQGKRFSNADRVRAREVAYRVWGALRALTVADTWKNAGRSFDTGTTGNQPNSKSGSSHVYTGSNKVAKGASYVLESPTRALAGADEWWRNVLQLSNIYGLAVRNAGNKGLKGKAFWDEVDNLINSPTMEMVEATNDYTKVLQFLDKPSSLAAWFTRGQTPHPNSSAIGRVARGAFRVAVPFIQTPDALIRTAIRRSPLSLLKLERENLKGWKAGGAERDKVKARMIIGSALAFYVASEAFEGNITGSGPADYKKKQEWLGSHQENSIKIGDEWYSIQGLEPVSTNIVAVATLVERFKNGEISSEDYAKSTTSLVHGIASVLSENSYLEGFNNLLKMNTDDPDQANAAATSYIAGLAGSAVPAIVRQYGRSQDDSVRDTTGDGSFNDRVSGRIKSSLPGESETLPQKYDVYGRAMKRNVAGPDMISRTVTKSEETDPAIRELARLGDGTNKVMLGAPGKNLKVNGETRRLTAEEFQKYQHLSGYWIVESVRAEMATPEWKAMSDDEKRQAVMDIRDDMRAAARDLLFNPQEEENEVEEEENE